MCLLTEAARPCAAAAINPVSHTSKLRPRQVWYLLKLSMWQSVAAPQEAAGFQLTHTRAGAWRQLCSAEAHFAVTNLSYSA